MVKIINGEIVADDDPRLQQRHQRPPPSEGQQREAGPSAGAGTANRGGGGGGGIGFSLSAPPLRFVDPPSNTRYRSALRLPDLEVFGVWVSLYAVLAAIALGLWFGLRGVVFAVLMYVLFLFNMNSAPATPQTGADGGPADFLARYLNGPQPPSRAQTTGGRAGDSGPGQGRGAASGGGPARAGDDDDGGGWAAFKGKGYKLSGDPADARGSSTAQRGRS